MTAAQLAKQFLEPPLYRPTALSTWGTVYTAVYDADQRSLELRWPDDAWSMSLDDFVEGSRVRRMSMAVPQAVEPHAAPPVAQGRPAAHRLTAAPAPARARRRARAERSECHRVGCRPLRAVLR